MKYSNISEYKEAILNAGVNFSKLSNLSPVLDDNATPIMIRGKVSAFRIVRGGYWNIDAECCRVSSRSMYDPFREIPCIGLRLGLSKF
jgi:formylglycine-generating enzyme required for sulfatase activity